METRDLFRDRPTRCWVEEHRTLLSLALQVFPIDTKTEPRRHLLAAGQLAGSLGFDAFFTADYPAPCLGLEGWLPLAGLAVKTERIRLGSHVNCIFYRQPVLLARLAADLDHISSGRLIQGLGCGFSITAWRYAWARPCRA